MSFLNDLFTGKNMTLSEIGRIDPGFEKIFQFVNVVSTIEERDINLSTIVVELSKGSVLCKYGQYNDTSMVCIVRNMIHRGNCDEEGGNTIIGKEIKADELPEGTGITFHYNDEKNEYDFYEILLQFVPTNQISIKQYMDLILKQFQTIGTIIKKSYYGKGKGKIVIRWFSS